MTDIEREQSEPFDFDLRVKKVKPHQARGTVSENPPEPDSPLRVIEALHQYVSEKKYVLLVGQAGAGKTKTLLRYLLELVQQAKDDPSAKIPILVQLKDYKAPLDDYSGIVHLIRKDLEESWGLSLTLQEIQQYLFREQIFLLLVDGLNALSTSKEAWKDISQFWDSCHKREISIVFTTRGLGYRNLGIETQLEIQPIAPEHRQRFIEERVSPGDRKKLQEWLNRAWQSDYTPFVMWMLATVCQQVNSSSQLESFSIGEAFREFVRLYQDRLYEEGRISDENCEEWAFKLEHLASEMMSDKITENFVISRATAIQIIGSEVLLNNLVRHHLLVERRGKGEIEFCHQLLQEYYVAEWLRRKLPDVLKDENSSKRFQHDYLNYLKWTEPIAIMLGLPEITENQAEELIDLALDLDLNLGARLAGEVKQALQSLAFNLIAKQQVCKKLKIRLLGKTRSESAVSLLIDLLEDESYSVRLDAFNTLGQIGGDSVILGLTNAFNDDESSVRFGVFDAFDRKITEISDSIKPDELKLKNVEIWGKQFCFLLAGLDLENEFNNKLKILSYAIEHLDLDIRWGAAIALTQIDSEQSAKILLKAVKNPNFDIQFSAAFALGEMGFESAVPILEKAIELTDSSDTCRMAIYALAKIESERAVSAIVKQCQENDDKYKLVFKTLYSMNIEEISPTLRRVFQDPIREVQTSIYRKLNTEDISNRLLQATHDIRPEIVKSAAFLLREIGNPEMLSTLWQQQTRFFTEDIMETIASIQSSCGFYNYEIYQQAQEAKNLGFEDDLIRTLYKDIDKVVSQIQENPELRQDDKEDRLTIEIVNQLRILEYNVSHETKIAGHADIVIRKNDFLWLGEAKIYRENNNYLWEGFLQLTTRYSIGDDHQENGGLLIYIRQEDASSIMKNWQTYLLDKRLPDYSFRPCKIRSLAFISTHKHEKSGLLFHVRHIPVMLHFDPKDKSGRRKTKPP
ncbi:MAG: AAA family ATPase [Microcoleus sp. CSU_2_2]|nr:AAA family ATPase [Microcoleus sp. CSU_2_2]